MGNVSQFRKENSNYQEHETTQHDTWEEFTLKDYPSIKEQYPTFCIVALFFHPAKVESHKACWNCYCISGDAKFHFNINSSPRRFMMLDGWKKRCISGDIIHGLCLADISFEDKRTGATITYTDIEDSTDKYCPCGVSM